MRRGLLLALLLGSALACSRAPGHGGGGIVLAAEAESDLDLGSVAAFSLTGLALAREGS